MNVGKIRSFAYFCCLLLAGCLTTRDAQAQTVTGSVTGEVTDATGALVPNAAVTVVNVDTGVQTSAKTNRAGVYSVRFLPIGHYTVAVEVPGFAAKTTPPFTL